MTRLVPMLRDPRGAVVRGGNIFFLAHRVAQ